MIRCSASGATDMNLHFLTMQSTRFRQYGKFSTLQMVELYVASMLVMENLKVYGDWIYEQYHVVEERPIVWKNPETDKVEYICAVCGRPESEHRYARQFQNPDNREVDVEIDVAQGPHRPRLQANDPPLAEPTKRFHWDVPEEDDHRGVPSPSDQPPTSLFDVAEADGVRPQKDCREHSKIVRREPYPQNDGRQVLPGRADELQDRHVLPQPVQLLPFHEQRRMRLPNRQFGQHKRRNRGPVRGQPCSRACDGIGQRLPSNVPAARRRRDRSKAPLSCSTMCTWTCPSTTTRWPGGGMTTLFASR